MDEMGKMKKVIVTGAAGFAGFSLTAHLLKEGYEVFAIARPNSIHNCRLERHNLMQYSEREGAYLDQHLHLITLEMNQYKQIPDKVGEQCDLFYHLAWNGGRDDYEQALANIEFSIESVEAAVRLGCTKYVGIGSQAEYGIRRELTDELTCPSPITAYGAAKLASLYMTKEKAKQLGIEWVWGRIFSLYGLYEPKGRLLPDLISALQQGKNMRLSDCTQNWDFLDVEDAARAILALGEYGHDGEIYNIANGDYRPLKEFVDAVINKYNQGGKVLYGEKANPYISLQPSVEKIRVHTGWKPQKSFLEGL